MVKKILVLLVVLMGFFGCYQPSEFIVTYRVECDNPCSIEVNYDYNIKEYYGTSNPWEQQIILFGWKEGYYSLSVEQDCLPGDEKEMELFIYVDNTLLTNKTYNTTAGTIFYF